MTTPSARGTILFAHGSRDPLWRLPIEAVAARIEHVADKALVRCAYLELSEPDLATSARELADLGVTQITVVPLFLGVGRHAREDLPELMKALHQTHPDLEFTLKPAVGEDPRLVALLAQIALE